MRTADVDKYTSTLVEGMFLDCHSHYAFPHQHSPNFTFLPSLPTGKLRVNVNVLFSTACS